MATTIKYASLFLILAGAVVLILSHFLGWNNINGINVGAYILMIIGLIAYIFGSKAALQEISSKASEKK